MKRITEANQNLAMSLTDLQTAWQCLREAVLYGTPVNLQSSLIAKIEEATQWDHVYDLSSMQKTLQGFSHLLKEAPVDPEVNVWAGHVRATLKEALHYSSEL